MLDLILGHLGFPAIGGRFERTLGEALESVGRVPTPAEPRTRPFPLTVAVRGQATDADPRAAGYRLRRQLSQLLDNPRMLAGGLYFHWDPDPELDAWLRIGGGKIAEADPSHTLGEWLAELTDVYVIANAGRGRPARRLELGDRRTGLVAHDSRGLVYAAIRPLQALPARPLIIPGDVTESSILLAYNRPPASVVDGPSIDGRILWREIPADDGNVASYLSDVDTWTLDDDPDGAPVGAVRVYDTGASTVDLTLGAIVPANDRTPELIGWERVYGPHASRAPELAIDNGACRLIWLGADGLAVEYWDDTADGYVRLGRVAGAADVDEVTIVELTTERVVIEWRGGPKAMRAILQRGWYGPRLEAYNDTVAGTARLEYVSDTGGAITASAVPPAWIRELMPAGILQRTNLLTNPSAETNITGWEARRFYDAEVLADNPQLFYPSITTGTAIDRSGKHDTATGLTFDGANDRFDVAYDPWVDGTTRTFEWYADRSAPVASHDPILLSSDGSCVIRYGRAVDNALIFTPGSPGTTFSWAGANNWALRWVHHAIVYNETTNTAELWIEGVSQGAQVVVGNYSATATDFRIGGGWAGEWYSGNIAKVAIYEGGLSGARIAAHAAPAAGRTYDQEVMADTPALFWANITATTALDVSGNGRDGTVAGAPAGVVTGPHYRNGTVNGAPAATVVSPVLEPAGDTDTALDLDGANDTVTIPFSPFANGGARTFEGWAWRDTGVNGHTLMGGTGAAAGTLIRIEAGSSNVKFYSDASGGAGTEAEWVAAWPGVGQWVHWAVVFDEAANTAELWINGISKGVDACPNAWGAAAGNLTIGAWGGTNNAFDGKTAKPAIYYGALSGARIAAHHAAGAAAQVYASVLSRSSLWSEVGTWSARLETAGFFAGHHYLDSPTFAVDAGDLYSARLGYNADALDGGDATVKIRWSTGAEVTLGAIAAVGDGILETPDGIGVNAPVGAVSGRFRILLDADATDVDLAFDALMVVEDDEVGTYFDGDSGNVYQWTGAAHASTSTEYEDVPLELYWSRGTNDDAEATFADGAGQFLTDNAGIAYTRAGAVIAQLGPPPVDTAELDALTVVDARPIPLVIAR